MNLRRTYTYLRDNFIFYLAGILVVLGMKYYYSQAGCDSLLWILAPTTHLVEMLSGIPFTYISGTGYVNHSLRLLIAPSCSGVRFMIITIATLVFSFVHIAASPEDEATLEDAAIPEDVAILEDAATPEDTASSADVPSLQVFPAVKSVLRVGKGVGWIATCVVISWLFTILVNGLRIIVAIYLPLYLERAGLIGGALTPDRLHTMIGVVVYFSALLTLYRLVDFLLRRKKAPVGKLQWIVPLFWYFFMTLGVPFLNRAYAGNTAQFKEFAALIVCCVALILLPCCMWGMWHRLWNRKNRSRE